MKDETDIVKDLKEKSSAFSDYLENGIAFIEKFYPKQINFILENKDKSFDEVRAIITQNFNATVQH